MTAELAPTQLSKIDHTALTLAVKNLENPNFAARLADYAGVPVNRVLGILPKVANDQLSAMVRSAIMKGLDVAIDTLEDEPPPPPATWFSSFLAGVTGGVSGLVGFAALPVELPLTTTFMLRAIAAIARHEGEDLSKIEARLACLEVFAFGGQAANEKIDVGYYAARALLSKYTNESSRFRRGARRGRCLRARRQQPGQRDRVALRPRGVRQGCGGRIADPGRGGRGDRQCHFHGSFSADRAGAFRACAGSSAPMAPPTIRRRYAELAASAPRASA